MRQADRAVLSFARPRTPCPGTDYVIFDIMSRGPIHDPPIGWIPCDLWGFSMGWRQSAAGGTRPWTWRNGSPRTASSPSKTSSAAGGRPGTSPLPRTFRRRWIRGLPSSPASMPGKGSKSRRENVSRTFQWRMHGRFGSFVVPEAPGSVSGSGTRARPHRISAFPQGPACSPGGYQNNPGWTFSQNVQPGPICGSCASVPRSGPSRSGWHPPRWPHRPTSSWPLRGSC